MAYELTAKDFEDGVEISKQIAEVFAEEDVTIPSGMVAHALLLAYARDTKPEIYEAVMKTVDEVTSKVNPGVTDAFKRRD